MSKPEKTKDVGPQSASEAQPESVTMSREDVRLLQESAQRLLEVEDALAKAQAGQKEAAVRAERAEAALAGAAQARDDASRRAQVLESRAEAAEQVRRKLEDRCAALESDSTRLHESLAMLRQQVQTAIAGGAAADAADPPKPGHRRVITVQAYSFEADRRVQTVPKGTVLQVPEVDFENDRLRRFPHLRDHEEHLAEQRERAKREAAPAEHGRAALDQILARVEDVMELRKEQRAELVAAMQRPEVIASRAG